jgi:large subunit ribosomal protein LP0
VKGNIGMVFTNGDLADIRTKLTELKIQAAAKAGSIAPIEVVVPAGNTNMEPTKTSFFQALSIPTKINRGTIEIINDIHLLTVGQKVSLSQAALLQMLGIRPYWNGLKVITVYDNGAVYPAAVLDLTDDDILKKFFKGVNNVAAISLQIGYPTVVSVPHSVSNGYKNLLAISVATDYTFPGSEKIKQLLSDPAAFAAAQAAAAAASVPAAGAPAAAGGKDAAPAAETKKPDKEKDEEEVDEDMGGLFGGEDEEEGY